MQDLIRYSDQLSGMDLPLDLSVRKTSVDDVTSCDDTDMLTSGESPPPSLDGTGFIAHDVSIPSVTRRDGEVSMSLQDAHIWEAFSRNGTEVVINKTGRRMFPHVALSASGLTPSELYNVWLEILPADGRRFKYVQNEWLPVSPADPCKTSPPYLHLDSPNTGAFWMQNKISFERLKLTNNRDSAVGNVMLQSMHKYKVQILISETGKGINVTTPKTFTFPETTFMAVTAYQNSLITKLKIHNNPFAKAFRDKDIGRNYQKQTCVSARSFSAWQQDTSLNNRKRKRELSVEDAAFKGRVSVTGGISAVGQTMSRTRTDLVTPYRWDVMPSERGSRLVCDVGQHTELSPFHGPFHHQASPMANGFCPLPPLVYPTRYLLNPEVFLPHPSNYPVPHPVPTGHPQRYILPNHYKDLSKDGAH